MNIEGITHYTITDRDDGWVDLHIWTGTTLWCTCRMWDEAEATTYFAFVVC